jgi:membrane-associated phospholipid phosphatase
MSGIVSGVARVVTERASRRAPDRYQVARWSVATLIVVFLDLWWGWPLQAIDRLVMSWAIAPDSPWRPLLHVPDGVGLRALTAPLLVLLALALRWRSGRWRPLFLTLSAILMVNLVIGSLKILVGRGAPRTGSAELFMGDMAWPSGHAANIAMTAALAVYLVEAYGGWHLRPSQRVVAMGLPVALMCTASVILGYHWVTDLVAGVAVGLLVAIGVRNLDADLPAERPVPIVRRTDLTEGRPDRRLTAA